MKHIVKFTLVLLFAFSLSITVLADNVRLVSSTKYESNPFLSFFSMFTKKAPQPARQTVATEETVFGANNGTLTVVKNEPTTGMLSIKAPEGTIVTYAIATLPQKGAIVLDATVPGKFTYTPTTDVTGSDSFTFTVSNEIYGSDTATVDVTIEEAIIPSPTPSPTPTPVVYKFRYEDMLGHWGETSAIKLSEDGILMGVKIGTKYFFDPERELTRGDFILYLVSALKLNVEPYREIPSPFSDAPDIPAWMNLESKAAFDTGIIKGSLEKGEILLRPTDKLTRLEAIAMLNNTIKPDAVSLTPATFADMYLTPEWGIEYIQNMLSYGLIKGYDDNTIRPYVKITRAMASEMINQTIKYNAEHPVVAKNLKAAANNNLNY